MTLMLASVSKLSEARLVAASGVDFIDLKNPAQGALGALAPAAVQQIVTAIKGEAHDASPTPAFSATIGDLPLDASTVIPAVRSMAACGVDYVKIGFFPGGNPETVLAGLKPIAHAGTALIAVLFADHPLDLSLIPKLQAAGFRGVMLDTADKKRGSLTAHQSLETLTRFIETAHQAKLLTGLAGSLRIDDIPLLLPLKPDYLGFRGALCANATRTDELDVERVKAVRTALTDP